MLSSAVAILLVFALCWEAVIVHDLSVWLFVHSSFHITIPLLVSGLSFLVGFFMDQRRPSTEMEFVHERNDEWIPVFDKGIDPEGNQIFEDRHGARNLNQIFEHRPRRSKLIRRGTVYETSNALGIL